MSVLLQKLPIGVGILAGSLIFVNRLLTEMVQPEQARSDALGLAASGVLILVGLLWQQVQPPAPVEVELAGEEVDILAERFTKLADDFALLKETLLKNTGARSVVVYYHGEPLYEVGRFEPSRLYAIGQISERVMRTGKPVYLVDLRLFPGRIEFAYLPAGTQSVVCQPLGENGIVVVGAAAVRSFSNQELAWIATLSEHLERKIDKC